METELKLMLCREGYERLLQKATTRNLRQVNPYFDLVKFQNLMLRIREKAGAYELTLKISESEQAGVFVNQELNVPISAAEFSEYVKCGISSELLHRLFQCDVPPYTAKYLGKLTTYRSIVPWKDVTLELDKNEYLSHVDYEVECESNDLQTLAEVKSMLLQECNATESRPKFQRFYERLQKGAK